MKTHTHKCARACWLAPEAARFVKAHDLRTAICELIRLILHVLVQHLDMRPELVKRAAFVFDLGPGALLLAIFPINCWRADSRFKPSVARAVATPVHGKRFGNGGEWWVVGGGGTVLIWCTRTVQLDVLDKFVFAVAKLAVWCIHFQQLFHQLRQPSFQSTTPKITKKRGRPATHHTLASNCAFWLWEARGQGTCRSARAISSIRGSS